MTNSEWLRTLSDETLARIISDDWCERVNCDRMVCDGDCNRRVLAWLKKERAVDYLSLVRELRRDYDEPLILEAAEEIEELTAALKASFATNSGTIVKAEPGWISTKERMPDANKPIMICTFGKYVGEGKYFGHDGYHDVWKGYAGSGTYWDDEVTHWMPLPEPPKEVE